MVMLIPLGVLAIGAILAGFPLFHSFLSDADGAFWKNAIFTGAANHTLHDMHDPAKLPRWVPWTPFVMMIAGFVLAYFFYLKWPEVPKGIAERHPALYRFLLNKWYFDELYDLIFVRPARRLGHFLWKKGDGAVIDQQFGTTDVFILLPVDRIAPKYQNRFSVDEGLTVTEYHA